MKAVERTRAKLSTCATVWRKLATLEDNDENMALVEGETSQTPGRQDLEFNQVNMQYSEMLCWEQFASTHWAGRVLLFGVRRGGLSTGGVICLASPNQVTFWKSVGETTILAVHGNESWNSSLIRPDYVSKVIIPRSNQCFSIRCNESKY